MLDDASLAYRVLLAQSGDREALESLLEELQGPLGRYLVGAVGDRHRAEDVLQDVLVLVCRKLAWLRDPEVVRPWAFRIAAREAARRLRRERGRERSLDVGGPEPVAPEGPDEPFPPEWLGRLPALIAAASPASRAVLILHYLEGLSLDEVAAVLDLAVGTVKSRLAYGLAALRKAVALGALGEDLA